MSEFIINEGDIEFQYETNRRWLSPEYQIETSLFTDDGEHEKLDWIEYCIRYCKSYNFDGIEPRYYIAVRRYANNNYYYTIIERLGE